MTSLKKLNNYKQKHENKIIDEIKNKREIPQRAVLTLINVSHFIINTIQG